MRGCIHVVMVWVLLLGGMTLPGQVFGSAEPGQGGRGLRDLGDSYARSEILRLADEGIVSGYEDGTFRPTQSITRAEMSKILSLGMALKEDREASARYKDVPADSWYAGFVGALSSAGVVQGTGPAQFSPEEPVTREQLVVFFVRAMGLVSMAEKQSAVAELSDFDLVSDWAKPHVALAYRIGFMNGIENGDGTVRFDPAGKAERQALARLAFEFKVNGEAYRQKANELESAKKASTPQPKPKPAPAPAPSSAPGPSVGGGGGAPPEPAINSAGQTLANFTITDGGRTYGPATGSVTVAGTLTVDPGSQGEVTLRNITAANLVVLSGSSDSIVLNGVKVTGTLRVDVSKQNSPVRIETNAGTEIAKTEVRSKAILENKNGSLGSIEVRETASEQTVVIRGTVDADVAVFAEGSVIQLDKDANVNKIRFHSKASLSFRNGASVGTIVANADIVLEGHPGELAVVAGDGARIDTGKLEPAALDAFRRAAVNNVVAAARKLPSIAELGPEHEPLLAEAKGLLNAAHQLGAAAEEMNEDGDWTGAIERGLAKLRHLEELKAASAGLAIGFQEGDSEASVTKSLVLPVGGSNGIAISWTPDRPDVVSVTGSVYRPVAPDNDALVSITARLSKGDAALTKLFKVTVKALPSAANRPPVAKTVEDRLIELGGPALTLSASALADDPDGNSLTVTEVLASDSGIAGLTLEGGSLHAVPLAAGTTTITATVQDSNGAAVLVAFKLIVQPKPPAAQSVTLEYLGHSSFVLAASGKKVLIDPWTPRLFGLPAYELTNEADITLITMSHDHEDHNYLGAAPTAAAAGQVFRGTVVSNPDQPPWEWEYALHPVTADHGDIKISNVNVPHFQSGMNLGKIGANAAFIYEVAGLRIVHLGDGMGPVFDGFTDQTMVDALQGEDGIDFLMIPIGDSMGGPIPADKVIQAIRTLQPNIVVPMHPWTHRSEFMEVAKTAFPVLAQPAVVNLTGQSLPNETVVWGMAARAELAPTADLTVTANHGASVELGFTLPVLAEDAAIELQQSEDGGKSWSKSSASDPLNAASRSAVVNGLSAEKTYFIRLAMIQGSYAMYSNTVNTAPSDEQILTDLLGKLGFHQERKEVVALSDITRSELYHYSKLELYIGNTDPNEMFGLDTYSSEVAETVAKGSAVIEGVGDSFGSNIWYRLSDSEGARTVWMQDGTLSYAPPNDEMMNGEFIVLGHEGKVRIMNGLGEWNSVNGYKAIIAINGEPEREYALQEDANTDIVIEGGLSPGDVVNVGLMNLHGNTSAYASATVQAGPTAGTDVDGQFELLADSGSIRIKNAYGNIMYVYISKNGVTSEAIRTEIGDPEIPVPGGLASGDAIRVAYKSMFNTSVFSDLVTAP